MMYYPGKESLQALDRITPWMRIDMERLDPVLRDDAPKEIVELCKKYYPILLT